MELKRVTISRNDYGKDKGKLSAIIETIKSESGWDTNCIKLNVPDEVAIRMMKLIAPYVVDEMQRGLKQIIEDAESFIYVEQIEIKSLSEE